MTARPHLELSPPAARKPIHRRVIELQGYQRDDGLWDLEGRLIDTKTYGFANQDRGGEIPAGDPIHEMLVRLTVDNGYVIHHAEAVTRHAPYALCGDITPHFSRLVGMTLGPGFRKELIRRFGGVEGCTHIVEMMAPLATTAFQTIAPLTRQLRTGQRPRILDTCHALASDGPIVQREWPEWYTGNDDPTA